MATLHDSTVRSNLESRLRKLSPASKGRWGKMSVDQMLWHVNTAMSVALGLETAKQDKAPLPRPVMKFLVLRLPWPKNAPTNPGFVARAQYDFEAERARCLDLVRRLSESPLDQPWGDHPMFGRMSGRDVSELQAKHLNHHLGQFGV